MKFPKWFDKEGFLKALAFVLLASVIQDVFDISHAFMQGIYGGVIIGISCYKEQS